MSQKFLNCPGLESRHQNGFKIAFQGSSCVNGDVICKWQIILWEFFCFCFFLMEFHSCCPDCIKVPKYLNWSLCPRCWSVDTHCQDNFKSVRKKRNWMQKKCGSFGECYESHGLPQDYS